MTHPAVGERVTHTVVNVDNAIQEGKKQMTLFESSWPAGFHTNISKIVTAMSVTKKHIKVGDTKGFNPELWDYSRALAPLTQSKSCAMNWRHFPHHCSTKLEICVMLNPNPV